MHHVINSLPVGNDRRELRTLGVVGVHSNSTRVVLRSLPLAAAANGLRAVGVHVGARRAEELVGGVAEVVGSGVLILSTRSSPRNLRHLRIF